MRKNDAECIKELKERGFMNPEKVLTEFDKAMEEVAKGKFRKIDLKKL